ncbi:DUF4870 domain-containing protein [Salinibacterium sp. ZJ77]|uniref:DUF4870 domain-containing protein n=1 Tax=Salinibacterium sp. ZJ77 TaxID=2708337 RepID=UPI0014228A3A|nr:DUF4870 domain-containing protein [Salinibacterium sp. ZJ77]
MTDSASPQPAAPLTEAEDKQWASFAHLGGIFWIIPALIIWAIFKDRGPRTSVEAKEALNFQITLGIAYVAAYILVVISFGLLFFLPWLVWIAGVVFSIIGFVKVNEGGSYRYPFALRLIK